MPFRGLLIAVVILAALGGGVYWSNKTKEAEANKPAADAAPKILSIPEDRIKRVEIKKAAGQTLILDRNTGGKWDMTAPKSLAVDQEAANSMISSLAALNAERLVDEKASDLSAYGLGSPQIEVTVTNKDGKMHDLLVGDETPTSGAFFAKLRDDPRIFTIASYAKSSLDKSPTDLRDKRLLTFDSDKLSRLELVAKGQALEFGKNNQNDWQILKPRPLRADGGQVETLIQKLKDAKMDISGDQDAEKTAASGFATGTQVAIVKVTDASGTQQLQVKRDKDNNYYAKSSVVEGVYKLPSDVGEGLNKGLNEFRNKKLFDFGWNDPGRVEIRDGAKQVSLEKSGDKWTSAGKQMDSTAVQTLIDKLRDLSAAKFVEQAAVATPVLDATVSSNDGKKVEKVSVSKQGETYFARRENEPTVYQLDPQAVTELQKAAAELKEAKPATKTDKKN